MKSQRASIAIIGGGIIGASIAYNVAKHGASGVVLLEKAKFGSGSTSAALGGFRHQFSNDLSIRLSKESIKIIEGFKESHRLRSAGKKRRIPFPRLARGIFFTTQAK